MHLGERGLAHDQDQAPALLEHHVGGAMDEVLAVTVGDAGERASRRRLGGSPAMASQANQRAACEFASWRFARKRNG